MAWGSAHVTGVPAWPWMGPEGQLVMVGGSVSLPSEREHDQHDHLLSH